MSQPRILVVGTTPLTRATVCALLEVVPVAPENLAGEVTTKTLNDRGLNLGEAPDLVSIGSTGRKRAQWKDETMRRGRQR